MEQRNDWVTLGVRTVDGLAGLQTNTSSRQLNQIDRVRARGVGDHISLPQLAVCGDQSAGKSSVLEGVTGIPFPRQDGVCTRFATEIILRHQPGMSQITAKILPSSCRTEDDRRRMALFERQLASFDELPGVIQETSDLMGIQETPADVKSNSILFAADVLRRRTIEQLLTISSVKYYGWQDKPESLRGLLLSEASHGNLQRYLELNHDNIPMSIQQKWCRQAVEPISYIHRHGVKHSDLRPDNYLVHATSPTSLDLWLCDFGGSVCEKLGVDGKQLPDPGFFNSIVLLIYVLPPLISGPVGAAKRH